MIERMKTHVALVMMLLIFLVVGTGCEMGRTSVGVGEGTVQTNDSGIDQAAQDELVRSFPPAQPSYQECPIIGPQGNILCSCQSYWAGEC